MTYISLDVAANLIISVGIILTTVYFASKYEILTKLRRHPAVDACDEAVRICSEKGRPFMYSMGDISVTGVSRQMRFSWVPSLLELQKHLASLSAKLNVKSDWFCYGNPLTSLMIRDYVEQGYVEGGKPEMFHAEDIHYYPEYISGTLGIVSQIELLKPAAGVVIGAHHWQTCQTLYEQLSKEGAFIVAGDVSADDNSSSTIAADYCTFGEENIAMGAYLSADPVAKSVLVGEDFYKLCLIGVAIGSTILFGLGVLK